MTLAKKLSSKPSKDADVNLEIREDGWEEVVEAEIGEATP